MQVVSLHHIAVDGVIQGGNSAMLLVGCGIEKETEESSLVYFNLLYHFNFFL